MPQLLSSYIVPKFPFPQQHSMAPSKRIAVAGGTGGIGSHIVEGLLDISQKEGLHVIVLSRTSKPDITFSGARAPVIGVDYNDSNSIESILREHNIDTVISMVADMDPSAFIAAQQTLLDGALRVPSVRRFAPSEFAFDSERLSCVKLFEAKLPILRALRKVKDTRPDFEFTKFNCGIFMNYYGFGNPKPDGGRAHGHLKQFPYIINIKEGVADIPGDGNLKVSSTTAEDVGRFTAAAMQLTSWPEESTMSGDVMTVNEVVEIAERITGVLHIV